MEMYSFIPKQFIIVCGVKCNNISFSYWCWIETHHSEITFFSAAAGAKRTLLDSWQCVDRRKCCLGHLLWASKKAQKAMVTSPLPQQPANKGACYFHAQTHTHFLRYQTMEWDESACGGMRAVRLSSPFLCLAWPAILWADVNVRLAMNQNGVMPWLACDHLLKKKTPNKNTTFLNAVCFSSECLNLCWLVLGGGG